MAPFLSLSVPAPESLPPFITSATTTNGHRLYSLPTPRLDELRREDLRRYFLNTWQIQNALFRGITEETVFFTNPDPLRNLLVFYLGHPAVFYINKLISVGTLERPLNERYERIFEVGVDPDSPADLLPMINSITWPNVEEVWDYRARVFELVNDVIDQLPLVFAYTDPNPLWALMMAIEHDRIHFETTSVLIRQLPVHNLRRPPNWIYAPTDASEPENSLLPVPGGIIMLGKQRSFPTFGWDNEYGAISESIDPFLASKFMITNGEYRDFVLDGGYKESYFWRPQGWHWRMLQGIRHPKFWIEEGGGFRYRAMFDEIEFPASWPAEVNYFEAEAFCRWKGTEYRIMRESEWNLLTEDHDTGRRHLPNNDVCFSSPYNLNLRFGSPSPVDYSPPNSMGFHDAYGNVWQWLADDFYPLPGFRANELYADFSAPYFGGKHKMLAGGSWATTGAGASKFYRLWFRKNFYQHAGFRIAKG